MGGMPGPKRGYGPALPGIIRAPFPNPYRDPYGWCEGGPRLQEATSTTSTRCVLANSTGSLAGVIVEPYQGAAGFIFPPKGWLQQLRGVGPRGTACCSRWTRCSPPTAARAGCGPWSTRA